MEAVSATAVHRSASDGYVAICLVQAVTADVGPGPGGGASWYRSEGLHNLPRYVLVPCDVIWVD